MSKVNWEVAVTWEGVKLGNREKGQSDKGCEPQVTVGLHFQKGTSTAALRWEVKTSIRLKIHCGVSDSERMDGLLS